MLWGDLQSVSNIDSLDDLDSVADDIQSSVDELEAVDIPGMF